MQKPPVHLLILHRSKMEGMGRETEAASETDIGKAHAVLSTAPERGKMTWGRPAVFQDYVSLSVNSEPKNAFRMLARVSEKPTSQAFSFCNVREIEKFSKVAVGS